MRAFLLLLILGAPLAAAAGDGDLNGDDIVDLADLLVVLQHFGRLDASADRNSDGRVDVFDLVSVARRYGSRYSSEVIFSDGFESGDLAGPEGGAWYNAVAVSVSTENPRTGAYSARFLYAGDSDPSADSWSEIRASFPNASEVWVEFWLYTPTNYVHRSADGITNNKFWILGYDDKLHGAWNEPGGWTVRTEITREGDTGALSRGRTVWGNIGTGGSSSWPPIQEPYPSGVIHDDDRGTWVKHGYHVRLSSGGGANDGVVELYKNDVLIANNTGMPLESDGFATPANSMELMGWANSGYDNDTVFYIDDVKVYSSDPGWSAVPAVDHPNEPAGLTTLMHADGSVAEANGQAFGIPGWSAWYGYSGGGSSHVYTVPDPENPTGSAGAVRFFWDSAIDESAVADYTYDEPKTEVYIAERFVYRTADPQSTASSFNSHKFYYHLVNGTTAANGGPWPTHEGGTNVQTTACNTDIINGNHPVMTTFDNEILLEWRWIAPSAPGVADGQLWYWVNGELMGHSTSMDTSCYSPGAVGWESIHFYMRANSVPEDVYMDVRELYVSAR